jgi:hypothetical protein
MYFLPFPVFEKSFQSKKKEKKEKNKKLGKGLS